MRTHEHWHDIEKKTSRAVQITREFIKALIDEPSKYIVPEFDPKTGNATGIIATTPLNGCGLRVEVGDWLVHHPNGDIQAVDRDEFPLTYSIRD